MFENEHFHFFKLVIIFSIIKLAISLCLINRKRFHYYKERKPRSIVSFSLQLAILSLQMNYHRRFVTFSGDIIRCGCGINFCRIFRGIYFFRACTLPKQQLASICFTRRINITAIVQHKHRRAIR